MLNSGPVAKSQLLPEVYSVAGSRVARSGWEAFLAPAVEVLLLPVTTTMTLTMTSSRLYLYQIRCILRKMACVFHRT